MRFELFRHFDVHEELPDIEGEEIDRVVIGLYAECINEATKSGIVWPGGTAPEVPDLDAPDTAFARLVDHVDWYQRIGYALKTPRSIWFYRRALLEAWKRLRGEVALQELMVVISISASDPMSAMDIKIIMGDLVRAQRRSEHMTEHRMKEQQKAANSAIKQLQNLPRIGQSTIDRQELVDILVALSKGEFRGDSPLQSISGDRRSVYWSRLATLEIGDGKVSDQRVLRDIKNYLKGGPSDDLMMGLIGNDDYPEVFNHFITLMKESWSRITFLFTDLIRYEIQKTKIKGIFSERKSYMDLWRFWLTDHPYFRRPDDIADSTFKNLSIGQDEVSDPNDRSSVLRYIASRIHEALDISIAEANNLYYYFSGAPNAQAYLEAPRVLQLRAAIVQYCSQNLTTADAWLLRLQRGGMFALYHLFFCVSSKDEKRLLDRPRDWAWAIESLIQACNMRADLIQPMLLVLISESVERQDGGRGRLSGRNLDMERARDLCGQDEALLLRLFAALVVETTYAEPIEARYTEQCDATKSQIKAYLE